MDYRALLKKYIQHVHNEEGTSFIWEDWRRGRDLFSDDEWAELTRLDTEVLGPVQS